MAYHRLYKSDKINGCLLWNSFFGTILNAYQRAFFKSQNTLTVREAFSIALAAKHRARQLSVFWFFLDCVNTSSVNRLLVVLYSPTYSFAPFFALTSFWEVNGSISVILQLPFCWNSFMEGLSKCREGKPAFLLLMDWFF